MSILRPVLRPVLSPVLRGVTEGGYGSLSSAVRAMFANGERGGVYDLSSMAQVSTGEVPATAVGDLIGRASDVSGNGYHALQATAASRPRLQSRVNRLTYTETPSNAIWTKTGSSVSGNKIVESATTGEHSIRQDAVIENGRITVSFEVAAAERTRVDILLSDLVAGSASASFDLAKGDVFTPATSGSWANAAPGIRSAGNGRWQIWLTVDKGAGTTVRSWLRLHNGTSSTSYAGDGTSGAYVYKGQVGVGGLSAYQWVTDSATFDSAGFVNFIDYDGADDSLVATFGTALGTNCTVVRATPGSEASILTAQTIGTSYTDTTDHSGLVIIDRALTASETATITAWANARHNLLEATNNSIAAWGDSLTAGTGSGGSDYPMLLAESLGRGRYNGGVGGETSTQIAARMVPDTLHETWLTVLWMGRNNFADPVAVKADIASCAAEVDRYLVVSVLPSAVDTSGEIDGIEALNADLLAVYGDRYVDALGYLQAHNDGSADDLADIALGRTPRSLRSDSVHLNAAGYQHVADCIAEKIAAWGW